MIQEYYLLLGFKIMSQSLVAVFSGLNFFNLMHILKHLCGTATRQGETQA